jgi:hypothetical protein
VLGRLAELCVVNSRATKEGVWIMDPGALALAAASLLAAKAGEGFAGEVGAAAWSGVGRLYSLIRAKLAGDSKGERALQELENESGDPTRVRRVAEVVQAHVHSDEEFRQGLEPLIAQARQDRSAGLIVAQAFDQAKQVNITGNMHGDISL